MNSATRKLFDLIFYEAHVIDCDFSQWDKRIRLVVVGGMVDGNFDGQGPIHQVDFLDAAEFHWKAHHLGVTLDGEDQHCQWVIKACDVEQRDGSYVINFWHVPPVCPDLFIKCRNVEITEIDIALIDRVNPTWNRPGCPLARPSLEELAAIRGDGA